MSERADGPGAWALSIVLLVLTFASATYVGATGAPDNMGDGIWPVSLLPGLTFSIPLLSILVSHELGHFIAAKLHRVDVSPPYFIPMPIALIGTMGAIIHMRGPIRARNALLDVGAAGPLAGLAVAIPVLVYGLATSPVLPMTGESAVMEGRSIFYVALLYLLKGPIPDTHDIFLSPTALAGWAGLLLTMINLLPVGQLDGGHIAYALFGPKQDVWSRLIHRSLPFVAIGVGLGYAGAALARGRGQDAAVGELTAGVHWLVWTFVLWIGSRVGGATHPETSEEPLTKGRRRIGIACLVIFVLLFMPSWMRVI